MTIVELFKALETTAGQNDKLALVEANKSVLLKEIFQYTFNNQKKYGVKNTEQVTPAGGNIEQAWEEAKILLDKLASRELTGNNARNAIETYLGTLDSNNQDIFLRILGKQTKLGISDSLLTKIWPDLVDDFEVALANKYADRASKVDWNKDTYYISRKLDGNRCVSPKQGDSLKFLSRQNKEFYTLGKIAKDVEQFAKDNNLDNFLFDGEIAIIDAKGNEDFQGILREIRNKDHTIENPAYCIFDILTIDEFQGKAISPSFSERYERLQKLLPQGKYKTLRLVEQEKVTDEVFAKWQTKADIGKWEGTMLRKDAPYKSGRSDDLLKVKKFHDAEYECFDIIKGEIKFAEPGKGLVKEESLSSILIRHKGNVVRVGSGFTKEQRRAFYENPSLIIGHTVKVQYFEETVDRYGSSSLRFPVFLCIRDIIE